MKSTTSKELPSIYLARHSETAWSLTGQHTGLTDVPLTERGEQNARVLGKRLVGLKFGKVLTSPFEQGSDPTRLSAVEPPSREPREMKESLL